MVTQAVEMSPTLNLKTACCTSICYTEPEALLPQRINSTPNNRQKER
ncbi:hypothetical protein [Serratia symbiotica]|nr:hypothetical protein [Serratia symbiotica]